MSELDHYKKFVSEVSESEAGASLPEKNRGESVSRRDFMRISAAYGMTATVLAAGTLGAVYSPNALAQAASRFSRERSRTRAKHTFRLGTVYSPSQHDIQRAGVWDFVTDLENRTDGEIRIEIIDSGSLCAETVCAQRAQQGVIDLSSSSTQNAASAMPWLNALDFPFMFQSSGQIYDFLFNPESERLFRKTYRERHGMEMLFSTAELRGVYMGRNFRDRPPVTAVGQLDGTRIRATPTQFGQEALKLLGMNPVPVAWTETLDAMRSGLVDGMETWAGAAAAFNMAPVITKLVKLNFIPGTQHVAMRTQALESMDDNLREAVMESAYFTQSTVMYNLEATRYSVIGDMDNPAPQTIYAESGTEINTLTAEALAEAEEIAHPRNPAYNELHNMLNELAGFDVYDEMLPIARRFPGDQPAINVVPRRWWKSA